MLKDHLNRSDIRPAGEHPGCCGMSQSVERVSPFQTSHSGYVAKGVGDASGRTLQKRKKVDLLRECVRESARTLRKNEGRSR